MSFGLPPPCLLSPAASTCVERRRGKQESIGGSEQALTAARPSRILTAFPFNYPGYKAPGPVVGLFPFQRATANLLPTLTAIVKRKTKIPASSSAFH